MITWSDVDRYSDTYEIFAACVTSVTNDYTMRRRGNPRMFGNMKFSSLCPRNSQCKTFNLYPITIKELEDKEFQKYRDYPCLYFISEDDTITTIIYYKEESGIRNINILTLTDKWHEWRRYF